MRQVLIRVRRIHHLVKKHDLAVTPRLSPRSAVTRLPKQLALQGHVIYTAVLVLEHEGAIARVVRLEVPELVLCVVVPEHGPVSDVHGRHVRAPSRVEGPRAGARGAEEDTSVDACGTDSAAGALGSAAPLGGPLESSRVLHAFRRDLCLPALSARLQIDGEGKHLLLGAALLSEAVYLVAIQGRYMSKRAFVVPLHDAIRAELANAIAVCEVDVVAVIEESAARPKYRISPERMPPHPRERLG
mmetsp:Transcript_125916/g.367899  ORF Transcript_125916/g.367899 Transcript_125916/m.367899 type:complete len:244 (-) Transcript_125916:108-839(-)